MTKNKYWNIALIVVLAIALVACSAGTMWFVMRGKTVRTVDVSDVTYSDEKQQISVTDEKGREQIMTVDAESLLTVLDEMDDEQLLLAMGVLESSTSITPTCPALHVMPDGEDKVIVYEMNTVISITQQVNGIQYVSVCSDKGEWELYTGQRYEVSATIIPGPLTAVMAEYFNLYNNTPNNNMNTVQAETIFGVPLDRLGQGQFKYTGTSSLDIPDGWVVKLLMASECTNYVELPKYVADALGKKQEWDCYTTLIYEGPIEDIDTFGDTLLFHGQSLLEGDYAVNACLLTNKALDSGYAAINANFPCTRIKSEE